MKRRRRKYRHGSRCPACRRGTLRRIPIYSADPRYCPDGTALSCTDCRYVRDRTHVITDQVSW